MVSDTGSEPEIRHGVVLPRVGAAPDDLSPATVEEPAPDDAEGWASTAPRHRRSGRTAPDETRPRRRLATLGAVCAVACVAVAGAVAFAPVWSARNPAPAPRGGQGPAALNQVPPASSPATPSARTSADIQATPKTHSPKPRSASASAPTPKAAHHWQTAVVHSTYVLHPGGSVRSNRLTLSLLTDGDLVLRDFDGHVTWSSGTRAQNTQAVFQADGNFVLYQGSTTLWSTRTDGHEGATLVLGADGAMRIVDGSTALWSTGT